MSIGSKPDPTISGLIQISQSHLDNMREMLTCIHERKLSPIGIAKWVYRNRYSFSSEAELLRMLKEEVYLYPSKYQLFRKEIAAAIERKMITQEELIKEMTWRNKVLERAIQALPEELVRCRICGHERHELDVNLIDYFEDVCSLCKPDYKLKLHAERKPE